MKKAKNSSSKLRHTNSTSNLFKVKHTSSSHASARPGGAHANNTTASSSSSTASPNMFRVNSSSNDLNNLAARDTSIGPTATRERSHSASSGGIRPRVRLVKILSLKPQSLEFLSKILSLSPAATKKELEEVPMGYMNYFPHCFKQNHIFV